MKFDPSVVPFSRAGTYMAISWLDANAPLNAGLYLRNLHGDSPTHIICRIDMLIGTAAVAATVEAMPDALTLHAADRCLYCIFSDESTLRCSGDGIGIRLTFPLGIYDHALQRGSGWQINSFSNRRSYALTAGDGRWSVATDARAGQIVASGFPNDAGVLDLRILEFLTDWPFPIRESLTPFAAARQRIATEFAQWLARLPPVPPAYTEARSLAAYVLWSARVTQQGYLQREAVLMSKNWMHSVWSWDHCFIAMALQRVDAALAWQQFTLPFDLQTESGALPDSVNDGAIVWNFCKPPVHGWTLRWMLRHGLTLDASRLHSIYEPLCRWTLWWLTQRDDGGTGLAHYNHGNDSGWDNSTLFDFGAPLATPDLSAWLVVQMQVLAELAQCLGIDDEACRWQQRAKDLLEQLLQAFWRDDQFVALRTADINAVSSDSLLLLIPIILGNSLPSAIRQRLVAALADEQRFLTPHGLATESQRSPLYQADGYWRGPVWAPVMFLIVESLREIGACDLAETLRVRFCDTVANSGMAENFDALTGQALRDPAHTWTAAVFILLAATS